jgi:hypothetical protein
MSAQALRAKNSKTDRKALNARRDAAKVRSAGSGSPYTVLPPGRIPTGITI